MLVLHKPYNICFCYVDWRSYSGCELEMRMTGVPVISLAGLAVAAPAEEAPAATTAGIRIHSLDRLILASEKVNCRPGWLHHNMHFFKVYHFHRV